MLDFYKMFRYVTTRMMKRLCRCSSVVTLRKIDTEVSILSASSSEHLSEIGKRNDRIELRCRRHVIGNDAMTRPRAEEKS